MKNNKKHVILSNPYAAMIILTVYGFFLSSLSGIVKIFATLAGLKADAAGIIWNFAVVLVGILLLIIHRLWFHPEFKGNVHTDFLKDKGVMTCIIAFIAIDLVRVITEYFVYGCTGISFTLFMDALGAGWTEEVICRGLVISTMMRSCQDKKSFMPALIFPALLFGMSHFALFSDGRDLNSVFLTVISASLAGLFFGAVYLRTGSILPSIGMHFLHDLIAMMVNTDSTVYDTVYNFLYAVLLITLLALTIILIKGHKEDILAVWRDRWSRGATKRPNSGMPDCRPAHSFSISA